MTITLTRELAAAILEGVRMADWLGPRYNVAPTQPVPALLNEDPGTLAWPRWDLREGGSGAPLINARAESLAEKPSFREAYARRRCLVLATGFYEWPKVGGRRERGPYYFQLRDESLMMFAGVWSRVTGPDGRPTLACAIVTTAANELVQPLHDRMPVIVPPAQRNRWLDPRDVQPAQLQDLLTPYPAIAMTVRQVSSRVNSVRNDDPACLAESRPDPQTSLPGFDA